ncbi:hypothetical protein Avbf_07751 [Armadillidium vulgare]|nr:hypothetical protein Avbf_07751 [Armadillidium vulgare]
MDGPMCTNHPIIATCLHLPTSGDGGKKSLFAGSIDTGAEKKTANYISDLAIKQIGQFEDKYKCKIVAYISDNENKMKLTRQLLETHYKEVDARGHNLGLLMYGCAAHYLNLVEKEVTPRTVLSHLVEVANCSLILVHWEMHAVQIWFEVLEDPVLQPYKALIQARFDDWITPFQLVAYATHPKYQVYCVVTGKAIKSKSNSLISFWFTCNFFYINFSLIRIGSREDKKNMQCLKVLKDVQVIKRNQLQRV